MLERFPESVVFASDYPHGDCTFPGATRKLADDPELSDEQRERVLWSNPCRLYGLAPEEMEASR